MVNKVILIGNLGRDPEVRSTPSGQPVATFTLATSRRWRDKNGQKQEQTEWHTDRRLGQAGGDRRPVPHQGQADLRRGAPPDPLLGRPQTGEKKYRTEVVCENFQMLGARGGGGEFEAQGQGGGYGASHSSSSPSPASSGPSYDEGGYGGEPEEDDIPF